MPDPAFSSSVTMSCGQIAFQRSDTYDAVESILDLSKKELNRGVHIHFANAWSVVLANRLRSMQEAVATGICYPDGLPVVWALRLLDKGKLRDFRRVRGPSVFEAAMRQGVLRDTKHYFLGSTEETLIQLRARVQERHPGIKIGGASSPPFRELSDAEWQNQLEAIHDSESDIVWVGLGTPKQDIIAKKLADNSNMVFVCVGAAFDFSAGNLKHAPVWMQNAGFEWLYRFMQEPRRLWRRYLIGNLEFVAIVTRQVIQAAGRRA